MQVVAEVVIDLKVKNTWYKLDNAGKLYPAIAGVRMSTVFRISVVLDRTVDQTVLQNALYNVIERFPYFKVNLRRGIFWYYFEYTKKNPKVEKETYYPCMFLNYKRKGTFPFRVIYYREKISVEFSHSITDGAGALRFLKSLVVQYFSLLGIDCESGELGTVLNEKLMEVEWQDAFHQYYTKGIPMPDKHKKAVHLPMKLTKKGEYFVVTGEMEVTALKELSARYQSTITEFLLALYFETIQEYVMNLSYRLKMKKLGRVAINTPINLRKIYQSATMKNFFVSLTPEIDLRLGVYSREELVDYVKNYMKLNVNVKNISRYISRNVANEKAAFIRIAPLFIKDIVMPIIYQKFGESGYTSSISNLGVLSFPKGISEHIKGVELIPPPSKNNKIKAGVISFGDKIYITFGKLSREKEIEKIFFRKLRKEGVHIKIQTNLE